jgi:hypothetical protein
MLSAQAVAMMGSPPVGGRTASTAGEALTIFAEAIAQIVSSANEDSTGSSAGAGTTS